jgi:hypothetical protein
VKSVEFCYWLQGMFELTDPKQLNEAQTDLVKRHLAMVFKHEIDPSYGSETAQQALTAIHNAPKIGGVGPNGEVYRC